MIKINLPVIILKGITLLPNNDIRLEFDNQESKNIIDIAELFHDNTILVVSQNDPLEESLDLKQLPKIGVIASISHRIELPNEKTRVIISGVSRAIVYEYMNASNQDDVIESIVSEVPTTLIDKTREMALIKKLYQEMEKYVKLVPYASNSILSQIDKERDLNKVTDIVASYLQKSSERLNDYLCEKNSLNRLEMILKDVYEEEETFNIEKDIDLKVKRNLDDSQREFILREKIKVIKQELGDISLKENAVDDIREKISSLNAPERIIERLNLELKRYESLSLASPEINVVRNYIDWLLDLPWNIETIDNKDLKEVRKSLDDSHSKIEKVKDRIIEYLAVKQISSDLRTPIICLVGPPGVGKTSLAFSIASAIRRKFVKMSVGGINDESEIIGHRRTYLGSAPGRIITSMKKSKSKNPVFLIDEIDKMTKDYKGDPASVLLEILDPEQNKYFSDNFIEEEFDLSKVMFITTANYVEDIPEALKDRLEIIELSGYTEYEKLDIAKTHLLPKIIKEHGLKKKDIEITDEALIKIIRNYTKESGVRELERQISTIIRKIVTNFVINKESSTKYIITEDKISNYLEKEKYNIDTDTRVSSVGLVNGLAYTNYGGDVLPIEVNYFKGKGNLILTGCLGEVMKESASIALDYIKANHNYFNIKYESLINNDIHIHVPEGAIKKEGPSAGIALTTALISAFTNKKINKDIALTGEITLRGKVLPIGGLKDKSIGANRCGIKTIIVPKENKKDLDDIPKEIKERIKFIYVEDYKEVYKFIIGE